jgi:transcriptional regulator with XRE-family HTH domain
MGAGLKMTPVELHAWMDGLLWDKKTAAARLGIARSTLDRYLNGQKPIPRLVALACAALAYGLPEHP